MRLDDDIVRAPPLAGENYHAFLARLHAHLRPETYLEIGAAAGLSLRLAECASVAIDPHFMVNENVVGNKPCCLFYQMSSDTFFRRHDPSALLGGKIDLAFIDGLHWFEYVLRDFANVERHCSNRSVIVLHDVLPPDGLVAARVDDPEVRRAGGSEPTWWTGDVWKAAAILKQYRPDLRIHALDAEPTGLLLVTNLDPGSTTLREHYFDLVAEFAQVQLQDFGLARYYALMGVESTAAYETTEACSLLLNS